MEHVDLLTYLRDNPGQTSASLTKWFFPNEYDTLKALEECQRAGFVYTQMTRDGYNKLYFVILDKFDPEVVRAAVARSREYNLHLQDIERKRLAFELERTEAIAAAERKRQIDKNLEAKERRKHQKAVREHNEAVERKRWEDALLAGRSALPASDRKDGVGCRTTGSGQRVIRNDRIIHECESCGESDVASDDACHECDSYYCGNCGSCRCDMDGLNMYELIHRNDQLRIIR